MGRDQLIASVDVGSAHYEADVVERHTEVAEAPDDLGERNLLGAVAAVAGVGIDRSGCEQRYAMVVVQRLDGQMGGAGKLADRQSSRHRIHHGVSPKGRVKARESGLTLPSG